MAYYFDSILATLTRLALKVKLKFYLAFTCPPLEYHPNTYLFRFGIPLVLKRTDRLFSTEAHALRFLNTAAPQLPIPRLIDSFQIGNDTFTLMTKLSGRSLLDIDELPSERIALIAAEVLNVIYQLWSIPQPLDMKGTVMASASGHGLLHPSAYVYEMYDRFAGPFPSTLACYATMTFSDIHSLAKERPELVKPVVDDKVVWVHTDLRMQNILIDDQGRLSGIVDWEDSGWYPRHWQLHVLRNPKPTCCGNWCLFWRDSFRFNDDVEEAYTASSHKDMLAFFL